MTKRIRLILPCHSLEDFPTHHVGDEAEGLLANWSALWHPALIAHTGEAPKWLRFDEDPEDLANTIVLMPAIAATYVSPELEHSVKAAGGSWIADQMDRDAIVEELLSVCGLDASQLDNELVADFYAFGYWFLQIELLTRQMRYTSNLDQDAIDEVTLSAANAVMCGDNERARELLQRGFTRLAEERDHYYPVDSYCLDLTLVGSNTQAGSVMAEFHPDAATNIWVTGRALESQAEKNPSLVRAIRERVLCDPPTVGIIGGEYDELALSLESSESLFRQLERGMSIFSTAFGRRPTVFFRRRFGLLPSLPSLLKSLGYVGAIHATLDAGWFPECSQARTQWQAEKGGHLEAIGCVPLDASKPETFLKLSLRMGQSMEMDYVATICLAHWAGTASHWYDAMRRGIKFGLQMGKQTTFDEYFESTTFTSAQDAFALDKYRSPYLNQAVAANESNPLSRRVRRRRMLDRLVQANRLLCWHSILNHRAHSNATIEVEIRELILRLDADDQEMPATETIDGVINQVSDRLARQLAMTGSSEEKGTLVINGGTSVQRVNLRNVGGEPDNGDSEPFVYATGFLGDETPASIVDLPMSGFAWLPNQASGLGSVDTRSAAKTATIAEEPLVDGLTLRNEFLQARVDEESGGLAGLFDFATRGNRLSQRLSTGPRPEAPKMVASEVQVQSSSGLYGEVQSKGVLLDDSDEEVAKFCQTFSLWRGSRTLLLRIQLEPTRMPSDKPWKDYLGCRWAWTKDDDQLYRTAHGMRFPTEGRRCEIPDYLEIENGKRRTYVLTGGLPYHTRISERTLDSLLLVRGETATEFEFGIGVDLRNPLQDATNFWLPELAVSDMNCPAQSHGWLFHIDARYVVADGWQPIWVDRQMDSMAGAEDAKHCVGFRVRLFESAGRACDATIRCPVAVDSAYKTDFFGEHLSPVIADESQHDDGAKPNNRSIRVPLGPYEWTEVEVRW